MIKPSEMIFCPRCSSELILAERGGQERKICPDESCGFVHWNNPVPVVGAIIERNGHVVLVQSKGWPENWYALVTGFMEHKETAEEAVLREVKEEVGLDAKIETFMGLYPFYRRNQLLIIYHVSAHEGEIQLDQEELADYREVPIEKVQPWPAGTGIALRDWLRSRGYERDFISFG